MRKSISRLGDDLKASTLQPPDHLTSLRSTEVLEPTAQDRRDLGDFCYNVLSRYALLFLLGILTIFFAYTIALSHGKSLWYDEIFSVIVATQPSWHKFAQAMPADANPPLYALLTRISISLFGNSDLGVRMPSILSFFVCLIEVYIFVRRERGDVFALLAVLLTLAEPGWTYAFEARPYALLVALMMLGLIGWQSATRTIENSPHQSRKLALTGMVIAIGGSILAHNVGILEVGVPLLIGEAVRLYQTRRPDWAILSTALVAIPALAVTLPMMHRTQALLFTASAASMHHLTFARLHTYLISGPASTLPLIISGPLVLVLVLLCVLTWSPAQLNRAVPQQMSSDYNPPNAPRLHAAAGAAILIPVTLLAMSLVGYYNCRYGIGSIAGIAILSCLLIGENVRQNSTLCVIVISILSCSYAHSYISLKRHPRTSVFADLQPTDVPSQLPLVIADPFLYMQYWYYSSSFQKNHVTYLLEKPADSQSGYSVVDLAMMAEQPLISLQLQNYTSFVAAHDHFQLCVTPGSPTSTLKARLEQLASKQTCSSWRQDALSTMYGDDPLLTTQLVRHPKRMIRLSQRDQSEFNGFST
jgi:hypothetical protein